LETNPIPIKSAMEMMGLSASDVRLPLTALTPGNRDILKKALIDYGIKF